MADQAITGKHIMLLPTISNTRAPPKEIKVKFMRLVGGTEVMVTLESIDICELCCGIRHALVACPKLASINKI